MLPHIVTTGLLSIATIGAGCRSAPTAPDVTRLAWNDRVQWDMTYVGLTPTVRGLSEIEMATVPHDEALRLVRLLDDKERWVAAHVILTYSCGERGEISGTTWHGLVVRERDDETTYVDRRKELRAYWSKRLSRRDEPDSNGVLKDPAIVIRVPKRTYRRSRRTDSRAQRTDLHSQRKGLHAQRTDPLVERNASRAVRTARQAECAAS